MLTHLYVKTHNTSGLKYFGKTTAKNPYEYKGSGKVWRRHIKKHGYDVSTEIVGSYSNLEECKRVAVQFSIDNDIVKSKEWANLKLESLDGGWDYVNENYSKTDRIKSSNKGMMAALSDESREKRKNTFSKIEHQQGPKNSQFGTMWITDGIENKKIKKENVIPDGWYKGRNA